LLAPQRAFFAPFPCFGGFAAKIREINPFFRSAESEKYNLLLWLWQRSCHNQSN
jgi:hypothetical protein